MFPHNLIKGEAVCMFMSTTKEKERESKYSTSTEHVVQYNLAPGSLFISFRAVSTL